MIPGTASDYLRQLHDLARRVQVSDASGELVPFDAGVSQAVDLLRLLRLKHGKVLLIGNGGSAAIAAHMQTDFCNSGGLRALVFNDAPAVTATSNDFGYGAVFEKPSRLWLDAGDVLIAVSSSGRSENILRAARACAQGACQVITMSGFDPANPLRASGHLNFYVPSDLYGHVELVHGMLGHMVSDFLAAGDLTGIAGAAADAPAEGQT
jgi:D-sedoheptulose 7-phosphate isomerase